MRVAFGIVCLLACLAALGCDGDRRTETAASAVATLPSTPSFRLVAFTDLSGYLEPCGCQSRPLGGIDKAAEQVGALRKQGVPMLVVSAGDLFFGDLPEGALSADDAKTQETWKAETLGGIFERLGLVAATPGARDLSYGPDVLAGLAQRGPYSLLPAKPGTETPESVASRVVEVGGTQLGLVGLSTFASPSVELERAREQALVQRAQAEIDRLRSGGARWVVVLVSGTQRLGRRAAGSLTGADFVLLGGLGEADVPPPVRVGQSYLLRAGRQGHGLLVVDVFARGNGRLGDHADRSPWTRRVRDEGLRARIDDLATRIASWEKDPSVDAANLTEQRTRLAALRAELANKAPAADGGSEFSAQFIELEVGMPQDATVRGTMDAYNARVNAHNKTAFADRVPKPAPAGTASFVGSERCKSCHASEYEWWTRHKHGHAFTTLEKLHKEFNLSCVACHVTGYEQPGGSTVTHNQGLIHVGCESCHGAGSKHVDEPDEEPAIDMVRSPTSDVCVRCHSPEHSDKFVFATYQKELIAPGHGLPLGAAAPVHGHAP
jgi:2',3'-cyclic-nucleotide 2'-phosphodiesterase (5'-nucleotidase family)